MPRIADHRVRALAAVAERMNPNGGNHPVMRQLQGVINRLTNGAAALDNVHASRSPLDTPAAHALKVAKMARKLDLEVTAAMNRMGEIFREGDRDVQRRIDEKIDLRPNAFAQEIRSAFRNLNGKAQAKLISELVAENRGPELAAIVKAPSVLTGISDDQRARYEEMIYATHAPAELAERAALNGVFEEGFAATTIAVGITKAFTDPGELANIERAAAASDAAGAAFDQSLQ